MSMAASTGVGRFLVDVGLLDDKRFEELSRFAVDTSMTLKDALVQQGGLERHRCVHGEA